MHTGDRVERYMEMEMDVYWQVDNVCRIVGRDIC